MLRRLAMVGFSAAIVALALSLKAAPPAPRLESLSPRSTRVETSRTSTSGHLPGTALMKSDGGAQSAELSDAVLREPGSMALLGAGLIVLGFAVRRKWARKL